MTLLCQTDLRNFVPKFLANMKIGQVLAEYVRTVEAKVLELTREGFIEAYVAKVDLNIAGTVPAPSVDDETSRAESTAAPPPQPEEAHHEL